MKSRRPRLRAGRRQLVKVEQSESTVTPVWVEFLCGIRDKREMLLARAFLKPFKAIDESRI